jgi:hypothetical protein
VKKAGLDWLGFFYAPAGWEKLTAKALKKFDFLCPNPQVNRDNSEQRSL